MTVVEDFRAVLVDLAAELPEPELLPERMARACARVLPVDGAGIGLFFADGRRLPLGASDPVAATAERLQFTVGAGPCLSAHAEGRAQVADEATIHARWPAFYSELVTHTPVRGVISLPLGNELQGIGALDLYTVPPTAVTALDPTDALEISAEVTTTFRAYSRAARRLSDGPVWLDAPAAARRSVVWQAMGFLNSGLGVTSTDALALLRAYAYTHGVDLDELATRIIDGHLPLDVLALDQGNNP